MKYILTSGCSFTKNQRLNPNKIDEIYNEEVKSWPYYLGIELGNEYKVLNYGGATNDNVSICRILLYHCKRLINEGVRPSDIIIIGQWSDPNRESIGISYNFDKSIKNLPHTLVYTPNWEKDNYGFFLTGGFSPPIGEGSAAQIFGIENAIKYWELEVSWNNMINPILHWFESWSLLERFCKDNKISTYWMTMRNIFSKNTFKNYWGIDFNFRENPSIEDFKKCVNETESDTWIGDFEVLKPYIDELPINKKNHWFYKNYNGLFEWSMCNLEGENPFQETYNYTGNSIEIFNKYLKEENIQGWGHPSHYMMEKFVKKELLTHIYESL